MAEAAVLVLLTSVTLAVTKGGSHISLHGWQVSTSTGLIFVAGCIVLRLALALASVHLSSWLSRRVLISGRQKVAESYLGASWELQHAEPAGRLQELMTSFINQTNHITKSFTNWLTAWLSLAAFLFAAVLIDPLATVFVLIALVVMGAALLPIRAAIQRRGTLDAESGLKLTNTVSELGSLGLEMHVFGAKNAFLSAIRSVSEVNAAARFRVMRVNESLGPSYLALAYLGVTCGVAVLAVQGASNLGTIGAVLLLMLRSLAYGQGIQTHAGSISAALPHVAQLQASTGNYLQARAPGGASRPKAALPIELDHMNFAYPDGHEVLHDISLDIQSREVIGVIGPSGAGKSTLAQLVLGLREPTGGYMRAGGCNLGDIDRDWWSTRVAVVAQDAHLLTGTVAENIRFFRQGIRTTEMEEALEQANLLHDMKRLPDGLDSHLGERGANLSGGQRQRLSIARALVGKPELLVLDEPTSALDVQSEAFVRDSIDKIRASAAVIIIAHRMSTLEICDRILILESGRIIGYDTPAALHQENEFYRKALSMSGIQYQTR